MKSKRELFIEFDKHLMEDIKPSNYFNSIIDENIMDVSPFYLLKDLVRTDQNLKHHPEGSVWNHTMMVVRLVAN
ncbi:hypothetical protein [Clostridium rectalis]|uniref:hypothetical protein n=1 Tax=Clostridium rectalis TaxID=2040295 RepID=UPI000F63B6C8|nr:hypothetical protein [Clostridium rectalis]